MPALSKAGSRRSKSVARPLNSSRAHALMSSWLSAWPGTAVARPSSRALGTGAGMSESHHASARKSSRGYHLKTIRGTNLCDRRLSVKRRVRWPLLGQQVFGDAGDAQPHPAAGQVALFRQLVGANEGGRRGHLPAFLYQQVGGAINF